MGKSIWEWLEIEPTKDIDVIKAAYAEVSKKYHPSEHPEEFKRLRDCYKMAINLAKGKAEHQVEVFSGFSYTGADRDVDLADSETAEKYKFNISKEITALEKEDADTSKYDFSSVVYEDSLSDRQKRMLSLFGEMMSFVRINPWRYGNKRVIETVMFNWDKSPYKEEITPVFIECILNIISETRELGVGVADVIEKILFTDSSNSQMGALHSRFRSVLPDINNTRIKEADFSTEDVRKCFCGLLNYPAPILKDGISYGPKMPYNMATKILPIKEILLFHDDKKVAYYFSEELSYSIDAKTDALTLYDFNNDIILKMGPDNSNYPYLLNHLAQNGSRYIGKKITDETGVIAKLEDYSEYWKEINYHGMVLSVVSVCLMVSLVFYMYSIGLKNTEYSWINDCMQGLFYIFALAFILVCGRYKYGGVKLRDHKLVSQCKKKKREFKNDIKNKDAEYVLGSNFYIFKRYIVFDAVDRGYNIILIDDIDELKCESKTDGDLAPLLVIKHYNGTAYYCRMYPSAVIERVIEIINERKEEAKGQ